MRKLIAVLALVTSTACARGGVAPGVWAMSSMTSPATRNPIITLKLAADGGARPTLILRCEEEVVDVYVMDVVASAAETPVVVRLDQGSKHITWESSSTKESIFYPGDPAASVAFIRELAASKTLGMTLTGASPADITFTVAGLEQQLPAFQKACMDALE